MKTAQSPLTTSSNLLSFVRDKVLHCKRAIYPLIELRIELHVAIAEYCFYQVFLVLGTANAQVGNDTLVTCRRLGRSGVAGAACKCAERLLATTEQLPSEPEGSPNRSRYVSIPFATYHTIRKTSNSKSDMNSRSGCSTQRRISVRAPPPATHNIPGAPESRLMVVRPDAPSGVSGGQKNGGQLKVFISCATPNYLI